MSKYSDEFKYQVVQEYLFGQLGYVSVGRKHNLDGATVRQWVNFFQAHGKAGLTRKRSVYTADFKMSVLQYLWDNCLSCRQAAAHFNIRDHGTIAQWIELYRSGGLDALKPAPKKVRSMPKPIHPSNSDQQPIIDMTQEEMGKELYYLRLENAYLKKLQALVQAKEKLAQKSKCK